MNNMINPYIASNNYLSIINQFNKINELEQRINILEKQIHTLNKKIKNKNNKKMTSSFNDDDIDYSDMYMV